MGQNGWQCQQQRISVKFAHDHPYCHLHKNCQTLPAFCHEEHFHCTCFESTALLLAMASAFVISEAGTFFVKIPGQVWLLPVILWFSLSYIQVTHGNDVRGLVQF